LGNDVCVFHTGFNAPHLHHIFLSATENSRFFHGL
jgi:hypothetical protein